MPVSYLLKKRLLILTLSFLISFFTSGFAKGQPSESILWQTIDTRHTIIRYQSPNDLKRFNSRIKYPTHNSVLSRLFSYPGSEDVANTVGIKIDALFEKAQQILDMRKKMEKVTINIYNNQDQLHEAYQRIYGRPCHIRAWYEYRFNTIYITIDDVHEGIMAHEMAHSIIDHYLLVRPPSATAEILARYVDSHLTR